MNNIKLNEDFQLCSIIITGLVVTTWIILSAFVLTGMLGWSEAWDFGRWVILGGIVAEIAVVLFDVRIGESYDLYGSSSGSSSSSNSSVDLWED